MTSMTCHAFIEYILIISSALLLPSITESTSFRLPNNTAPKLYIFNLEPRIDDEKLTFSGNSSIEFVVLEPTDTVTVHSSDLIDINQEYTLIICSDGKIERPVSQEWNSTLEFFNVKFESILPIGDCAIQFVWEGRQDDPPRKRGLHRHQENVNGTLVNTLAAAFEPRGARTVFPCWDEPGLKAEFLISIQHNEQYKAVSNMPVQQVLPIGDDVNVLTIFEKSPPMSTYQWSIVVGTLESITNEYKNMTYWVQPDRLDDIKFTVDLSPSIVAVIEDYTGIPYVALPKLDSVFIYDYPAAAMENWGAITYSHEYLRKPNNYNNANDDLTIATTVTHEITHQWFGNLVTHKWWNDLWLTEAFTQYLSNKFLDSVSSRWQAVSSFTIEQTNKYCFHAEDYDAPGHPITFIPDKIDGPEEKIGVIVYYGGACVIRMMEHILSDDVFQKGIREYLNKHKFNTVTTDDLFRSLQKAYNESEPASPLNLKKIINPWLNQNGHPRLNVTRNYETGVITITQKDATKSNSTNRWTVPITYATTSEPNFEQTRITHWIEPTTEILEIHEVNKDDWIILNIQSKDYYQITYDFENWKRIADYLNSENFRKIHMLNRAQLLYDMSKFDGPSDQIIELTIALISYLSREDNSFVLKIGIDRVISYTDTYVLSPVYDLYKKFAMYHMRKIIDRVGYDASQDDDDVTRVLRFKLFLLLSRFGDEELQEAGRVRFLEYLNDGAVKLEWNDYNSDENQWMLCYGLASVNETIWEQLGPSLGIPFYLPCSNNVTLITNLLLKMVDGRIKDFYDMLGESMRVLTSSRLDHWDFAFDFYVNNIEDIRQLYLNRTTPERTETKLKNTFKRFTQSARTLKQEEKLREFLNGQGADIKDLAENIGILSKKLKSADNERKLFEDAVKKRVGESRRRRQTHKFNKFHRPLSNQ